MTRAMQYALDLLRSSDQPGVVMGPGDSSRLIDGQPWIHFQTARALERRGLVSIQDGDVFLSDPEGER
jgi:hypothetical protein